jgi:hypothetical protein
MLGAVDPVVTPGVVLPDGPPAAKADAKPAGDAPMRVLNMRSLTTWRLGVSNVSGLGTRDSDSGLGVAI